MPGIPRVYDLENKDIEAAIDAERQDRARMIEKARRYYDGDHDRPLKVDPMERDDNIILNLAGQTIDKTVDFIGTPTFSTAAEADDAVEALLAEMVKQADMQFLIPDVLTSGMIAGHSYLRIILPDGQVSASNPPMLAALAPEYVTVCWDMGFYGMKSAAMWYRLEWEFGDIKRRQDIIPANLYAVDGEPNPNAEGWYILEYEQNARQSKQWELVGADDWPFPFPPIVDAKNRRKPHSYYGESDLKDLRLNDAVNFTVSNTARIIKHHAHPKTVLFGDDGSSLNGTRVDGMWAIPNDEARMENLEMQSDLQSSMGFLEMLRSSWFTQARVVDMTTQKDKLGSITNFGVRMLFSDMLKMADDKRESYGRMLETALERMLAIVGVDADVLAHWPEPLPVNRLETVQTAQSEQMMGVSKQTTFEDLDRDYDAELERKEQEIADEARLNASRFMIEAQGGAFN